MNRRQKLRRQNVSDGSSSSDGSFSNASLRRLHFPVASNNSHQIILKENHEELLEGISLNNTVILDNLYQNEALTESDIESIRMENSRKDQVRTLLLLLQDRGMNVFKQFVTSLKTDFAHLEKKLLIALEESEKQNVVITKCTICRIETTVSIRDIIDRLYSKGMLSPKEMKSILKCSDEKGWSQLKPVLNKNREAKDVLAGAMAAKYPDLSEEYSKFLSNKFSCFCKQLRVMQRANDICSTQEYITTSSNRSSTASSTSSPTSSLMKNEEFKIFGDCDQSEVPFRGEGSIIEEEHPNGRDRTDEKDDSDLKALPEMLEATKIDKNIIKRTGFNRKAQRKKDVV